MNGINDNDINLCVHPGGSFSSQLILEELNLTNGRLSLLLLLLHLLFEEENLVLERQ